MKRLLGFCAAMVFAATLHAATDVMTIGSVTAPNGTVSLPVYVRDVAGTPLGTDKGSGKRIQGIAFRVSFSNPGAVSSPTFTRAGVLAGEPLFETSFASGQGFGYVASYAEGGSTLPFVTNAAAPGQLIGYLVVTLQGVATGSTVDVIFDPLVTVLSNQAGTVVESYPNTALTLQGGTITVGACPTVTNATTSITGQASACEAGTGGTTTVTYAGGSANVQWGRRNSPGGTTTPIASATAASYVINGNDFPGAGTYYLVATVSNGCSVTVSTPMQIRITSEPDVTLSASTQVYALSTENFASVEDQGAGATYNWSATNATITSGQGTRAIRYTAGSVGAASISVTVTGTGCSTPASRTANLTVISQPAEATMLYLITPCRVYDSRYTSALGGSEDRDITVAGLCGVPAGAKAVAVNVSVVSPPASGWLSAFPSNLPWPGTSTINYRTGRTRANNAVVRLSNDGHLMVRNSGSTLHVILDVSGYFK